MRSYFLHAFRKPNSSKRIKGVFPEVCMATSMSRNAKVPNQWILEEPVYHVFKNDGAQFQESTTNAQQPKTITLLPVED